jgi:hypothetical protein
MLDQDQLLDNNSATSAALLTDRQIIGILLDKEKFPKEIVTSLEFELQRRNLSNSYLKALEFELNASDIVPALPISKEYKRLLVFWFIIQTAAQISSFLWQIIMFTISIRAIKNRFTKGASYQKSTWRKFELFMLVLIIVIYVSFFFLSKNNYL